MSHSTALLAMLALLLKFDNIAVELLEPPEEMEFEIIRAVSPHEEGRFVKEYEEEEREEKDETTQSGEGGEE